MKSKISINLFVTVGLFLILTISCEENQDNQTPIGNLNIDTLYIPGGNFIMGSLTNESYPFSDETQHQVTLSAFYISRYEITNGQYAAFLNSKSIGSNGIWAEGSYPTKALIYASSGNSDFGLHYNNSQWIPVAGYENHPVIDVSWYGATEFATYAGGTLPTEAQWEFACRGKTTTPFNTGDCLSNEQANYDWAYPNTTCTNINTASPSKTQAVGSYTANAYGLYDMHGNVAEWCSDWYGNYPTTPQINPTGPLTGSYRIIRGGSWGNIAVGCTSYTRNLSIPDYYDDRNNYIGFRVVFVP